MKLRGRTWREGDVSPGFDSQKPLYPRPEPRGRRFQPFSRKAPEENAKAHGILSYLKIKLDHISNIHFTKACWLLIISAYAKLPVLFRLLVIIAAANETVMPAWACTMLAPIIGRLITLREEATGMRSQGLFGISDRLLQLQTQLALAVPAAMRSITIAISVRNLDNPTRELPTPES